MSEQFDELVKALGVGTSRRTALRRFLGAMAAAVVSGLPGVGASTAAAAGPASAQPGISSFPFQINGTTPPGVNGKFPGVNGKIPGLNGKVPGLNGKIPGLNGKIPGLNGKIPGLNGKVPPGLKKKKPK